MLSGLAKRWLRYYYGLCDLVTVPSETTKQQLIRDGFKVRMEVVSNGVDTKRFNQKKFDKKLKQTICPKGELFVLYVGRITKEKNIDFIIKNFPHTDFKLVITSDGPYREGLEKLVSKLGVEKNVVFTGYLSKNSLDDFYSLADIFVMASKTETQGMVLIEAALRKLPTVVLGYPVIGDFVKENGTGLVASEGDFSDAIESAYKERKKFMNNCLKAAKKYDIKKCTKQLISVYENAINSHKK